MKKKGLGVMMAICLVNVLILHAGQGVMEEILLESVSRGNHERIKKLLALDFPIDINSRNKRGDTALLLAARSGMLETVQVLIQHGADPDIRNASGETPLLATLRISGTSGEYLLRVSEIARLLINRGTCLSFRDQYGRTYLMTAAENGKESVIKALLSKPGINIDCRDKQGLTALMYAVRSKRIRAAERLVTAGAKPYLRDNIGKTALHYGVADEKLTTLLLDHGARIEATDRRGFTALLQAVEAGNIDVARLLLKRGANINAVDSGQGRSSLMLAINKHNLEMAAELLSRGADVKLADKRGQSPVYLASVSGFSDMVDLLLDHGSPVDTLTPQGVTPLMGACERGFTECAGLLLKRGADMEATSGCGWSPLFYAVFNGHYDVTRLLLEKGASATKKDRQGRSPVDLARERKFTDILNLLI